MTGPKKPSRPNPGQVQDYPTPWWFWATVVVVVVLLFAAALGLIR